MGWREVWDSSVHRMAGFSRSLPMLFARGSLGQRHPASSRNAHGGLGPVLQLGGSVISKTSAGPLPRGLGAQRPSHPVHPVGRSWSHQQTQQMQGSSPRSPPEQLPALQCGAGVHGPHALPPTLPQRPPARYPCLHHEEEESEAQRCGETAGSHTVIGAEAGSELV